MGPSRQEGQDIVARSQRRGSLGHRHPVVPEPSVLEFLQTLKRVLALIQDRPPPSIHLEAKRSHHGGPRRRLTPTSLDRLELLHLLLLWHKI